MSGPTMRAAVVHGPGDVRVEDRPVPCPTGTQVLVEVSHCGVCGTDLHLALDGWARPGNGRWPRVVRHRAGRGGRRGCGGGRRHSGRRSGARMRGLPLLPRRPALAVPVARHARPRRARRRVRHLRVCRRAGRRAGAGGPGSADGGPGRAAGGGPPRGDPQRGTAGPPRPRLGRRADRPAGGGRAAGSGRRGGRGQRAAPRPARPGPPVGATDVVAPDDLDVPSMAEPRRLVAGAVDVAIECSGQRRRGVRGVRPADDGRPSGARRQRHRPAGPRPQPRPAERARGHRRLRVRPRRDRRGHVAADGRRRRAVAAGRGRGCRARAACRRRWSAWPTGRSPARCWWRLVGWLRATPLAGGKEDHEHSTVQPRGAERARHAARRRGPGRDRRLLRRRVRLGGDAHDDDAGPPARVAGLHVRPVRVPRGRRRPDAVPPHRPRRHGGGHARRAADLPRARPGPGRRRRSGRSSATRRSTISGSFGCTTSTSASSCR